MVSGVVVPEGVVPVPDVLPEEDRPGEGNEPGMGVSWSSSGSSKPVLVPVDGRPVVEGVQSGLAGMCRAAGALLNGPGC